VVGILARQPRGYEDLAGQFVVDMDDRLGYGWCAHVEGGKALVRYMDLPDAVVDERRVPVTRLQAQRLPNELRVWIRNKGFGWWPGRIKGLREGVYLVKLAGVPSLVRVPPWSIQVRWDQPLVSATDALAIGMTDSPRYYKARSAVMRNFVEQRAACRGFTGLLSATVQPYHHQIAVLTRVLADAIMRFVLADEVGLGKTIEAGLIIRQLLLDDPRYGVVVSVPHSLVGQWVDELSRKLLLDTQLDRGSLRVIDHDELRHLEDRSVDLLVIDEAHRVVERAFTHTAELEHLQGIARAVPSLLLLTATPIRGHEQTFLGLLHLIDPEAYALGNLEEFRRRLELRHEQASAIELLAPGVPTVAVRGVLREFADGYRTDPILQDLIRTAEAALDRAGPTEGPLSAVADHLRETYRLSRRVIRNRRGAARADGFPISDRRLELVDVQDAARDTIDDFLEHWRQLLRSETGDSATTASVYANGVEAGLAGSDPLLGFIDSRLEELADRDAETEKALLRQTRATLARRQSTGRYKYVLDRWKQPLRHGPMKRIIFTSFPASAAKMERLLREAFGERAVALHGESMTPLEQDEAVLRFFHDPACRTLVCDASAEEGRNLQVATEIIHLDLPLSVNRLEQRIGRVDRFNESSLSDGIPSVVLTESNSPWVTGHLRVLTQGVGVFEHSVATLQRPLAENERDVASRLLALGVRAFDMDVSVLRERLNDERNQIDLLEELESTLTTTEFNAAAVDDLVEFEATWQETANAFDRLTSEVGGILLAKREGPIGVFSYGIDKNLQAIPLMPAHRQQQLAKLLPGKRTFNRELARGTPKVRLLRLGDPLVDWIEDYLRVDEGGRARASWRYVPGWAKPEAWFCFDFLLEFDERTLAEFNYSDRGRLARRGDAFLPPRLETVWTDGEVEAPTALREQVLESSAEPPVADIPLRGRRWAAALDVLPDWPSRCRRASERARDIVASRPEVRSWSRSAADAAGEEAARRAHVLRLWAERLPAGPERDRVMQEVAAEQVLGLTVAAGIAAPRYVLLAAGSVLVSGVALER
jgi:ATP-dependent helicase HepA